MRGATVVGRDTFFSDDISIHAPHAGRDGCKIDDAPIFKHFNPRAPCGARRAYMQRPERERKISIHAPHAGRDLGNLSDV